MDNPALPVDIVFSPFPKIARLNREVILTEKIDGTNASVHVLEDGRVLAASRTRFLSLEKDNFGFAKWVAEHEEELRGLGLGSHFGEWWGAGIQRGYGLAWQELRGEKWFHHEVRRFSLFNVSRWSDGARAESQQAFQAKVAAGLPVKETDILPKRPDCCHAVPVLAILQRFDSVAIENAVDELRANGSVAKPGFAKPEGVVVFHSASSTMYKVTVEGDEKPKGQK